MRETTGSERTVEELEAAVLGILDLYFEARLREVAQIPRKVGPAVEAYEEARRQLAEAEEKLQAIRRRTQELKASTVDATVGDSGASELQEADLRAAGRGPKPGQGGGRRSGARRGG